MYPNGHKTAGNPIYLKLNMEFRNNKAAFIWVFAAIFLSFVAAMTYILLRDGAPHGYAFEFMGGVMAIFWLGGLGLGSFAASQACQQIIVLSDGRVVVRWRYPFRSATRTVPANTLTPAQVIESRDSENDPYFYARFLLPDGTEVNVSEGHDRESCGQKCDLFNDAVWRRQITTKKLVKTKLKNS